MGSLRKFVSDHLKKIEQNTLYPHDLKGDGCLACGGAIQKLQKTDTNFNWKIIETQMRTILDSLPSAAPSNDSDWAKAAFFWNLHKVIQVLDDEMEKILNEGSI